MTARGRNYKGQEWDPMRDDFNNSTYEAQYPDENASEDVQLDHRRLYITNIPKGLNDEGLRAAFAKFGNLIEVYLSKDPQKRYGLVSFETSRHKPFIPQFLMNYVQSELRMNDLHKRASSDMHTDRALYNLGEACVQQLQRADDDKPEAMIHKLTAYSPGGFEAKLAMMKMNRTEPLRLFLSIAHKTKAKREDRQSWDNRDRSNMNSGRERSSYKEDTTSVGSRGKYSRKEEANNGDSETVNGFPIEEEMSLTDPLDASLNIELENIKLEQLKLREEQLMCKHRMLLLKQAERKPTHQGSASTRHILPDGRIVVRNVTESRSEIRDADVTYAAGAGDSRMPALQRDACRQCVCCGAFAEQFCARCGVTPYCSARCQKRDWGERHRAVCHNLARLSSLGADVKDMPDLGTIAPAPALRRPRRPSPAEGHRSDDTGSEKTYKNQGGTSGANRMNHRSGHFNRNQDGRHNFKRRDDDGENKRTHSPQKNFNRNETLKQTPLTNPSPLRQPKVVEEKKAKLPEAKLPEAKLPGAKLPEAKVPDAKLPEVKVPEAKPVVIEAKSVMKEVKPMSVEEKTILPVKNVTDLVPKTYLLEHLSIGDSVILSVDGKASDCRTSQPGYVCLSMHEKFEADYQKLCEDYVVDCEAITTELKCYHLNAPRPIKRWLDALKEDLSTNHPGVRELLNSMDSLSPGVSLSYLNPDDGGWYRARCLNRTTIALLDSGKVVELKGSDKLKELPGKYRDIPEFCCVLDGDVEIGANLKCTLISESPNGFKVSIQDFDTGSDVGVGEAARWTPAVEYPAPPAPTGPTAPATTVPEVRRPPLQADARVILTDACGTRVCVRPATPDAQRSFDAVLQDVVLYGTAATPLKESPTPGQTVVAKFSDGLHYRAMCKRTNVKQNKYQLEYIEYGNIEVSKLELLYPCPQDYDVGKVPPVASIMTLDVNITLTPDAEKYLDALKEETMILKLPDGAETAPSGSVANLIVVKSNENLQKKLLELSTPDWKKIEERGGDVVDTARVMFSELRCVELPARGGLLTVLDASVLEQGNVAACPRDAPHHERMFTQLSERMAEYCNSELGRQPYLPKPEELCIAQCPPSPQWLRAAFLEQLPGPGGHSARVLYVDTGYVGAVPVTLLRKMLHEFLAAPALACHLDIKGFPANPTQDMLSRARQYMKIDETGRGELRVTNCVKVDDGMYVVEAEGLLAAMGGK